MLNLFVQTLTSGAISGLVFSLPLLAFVWFLNRRRQRFREEALEPFTEMPLRPPGESLRVKIEEKSGQMDEVLLLAALTGLTATAMVSVAAPPDKLTTAAGTGLITACIYAWSARRMFTLQKQLWNYRLGFTGERVTGETLNQLLAQGFSVFHDLPFDAFNIDHVIVGPAGVYVVETKTRRKRSAIKGVSRATVSYDGEVLQFPRHQETEPIEQARLNAKTLSIWLSQSTGEHTPVSAIVALPGWLVVRTGRSDVNVLNPKEIINSFPNRPSDPLTPERLQRIVYQLTERCRMAKPS